MPAAASVVISDAVEISFGQKLIDGSSGEAATLVAVNDASKTATTDALQIDLKSGLL